MQIASAQTLGYATTALITALLDTLQNKGVLNDGDLRDVIDDALAALRPDRNIIAINDAYTFVEKAIVPHINKRTAR